MKIELIKEEPLFQTPFYCVEVDGNFVSGSVAYKEEEAKEKMQVLKENGGKFPVKKEVIESIIINEEHLSQ